MFAVSLVVFDLSVCKESVYFVDCNYFFSFKLVYIDLVNSHVEKLHFKKNKENNQTHSLGSCLL